MVSLILTHSAAWQLTTLMIPLRIGVSTFRRVDTTGVVTPMNVFSVEPVTFLPTEALNLGRRPSCIKTQSISAGVRDLGAVGFCRSVPIVEAVHSVPSVGVAGTLFSCTFWVPDTGAVDKTNKEEEEPEYGLHVYGVNVNIIWSKILPFLKEEKSQKSYFLFPSDPNFQDL